MPASFPVIIASTAGSMAGGVETRFLIDPLLVGEVP